MCTTELVLHIPNEIKINIIQNMQTTTKKIIFKITCTIFLQFLLVWSVYMSQVLTYMYIIKIINLLSSMHIIYCITISLGHTIRTNNTCTIQYQLQHVNN